MSARVRVERLQGMNDTMRTKADFDTVSDAIFSVHRKHRKAAEALGMDVVDFINNKPLVDAMKREEEEVCTLLGWVVKEFYDEEHRQIMASMAEEN
mgnify:CR=1 FL=1